MLLLAIYRNLLFPLHEMVSMFCRFTKKNAKFAKFGAIYQAPALNIHSFFAQGTMARFLMVLRTGTVPKTNRNRGRNYIISFNFFVSYPPIGAETPHPPSKSHDKTRIGPHNVLHKNLGIFHFLNTPALT